MDVDLRVEMVLVVAKAIGEVPVLNSSFGVVDVAVDMMEVLMIKVSSEVERFNNVVM